MILSFSFVAPFCQYFIDKMKYFIALYENKIGIRSIVLGISVLLCKFCAINYVKSNIVEIYSSMKIAW